MSYIKATRTSDWTLHLASVRSMLPWMFAYDRVNYSRYLSAYWIEMSSLEQTHPGIYPFFTLSRKSFSKIPSNESIEIYTSVKIHTSVKLFHFN